LKARLLNNNSGIWYFIQAFGTQQLHKIEESTI
jgi:hypothetical protein